MKLVKKFELTEEEKIAFDSFINILDYMDEELYEAFTREVLGVSFHEIDLYKSLVEFKRKHS